MAKTTTTNRLEILYFPVAGLVKLKGNPRKDEPMKITLSQRPDRPLRWRDLSSRQCLVDALQRFGNANDLAFNKEIHGIDLAIMSPDQAMAHLGAIGKLNDAIEVALSMSLEEPEC